MGDQIARYAVAKRNICRTGAREIVLARNFAYTLTDNIESVSAAYPSVSADLQQPSSASIVHRE
eukprot:SAG11_NODE_1142_length_5707_cov_5.863766_4_plen_64_part_00